MNGDRRRFVPERMMDILKTEFLIPEDMLDKMGIEQASAALEVYGSVEEFLEKTGWGRDNPEFSSEEYLTRNRICRWVDGKLLYFSRLVWENGDGDNEGELHKWGAKITFVMLIASVLFSTAVLGRNLWMQEKEQMKFEDLKNHIFASKERYSLGEQTAKPEQKEFETTVGEERTVLPEYQEIVKENPDFAGWISIEGTNIDYPVMQTSWEPEYYLHRNFAGEDSYAGVPFVGIGDIRAERGDVFIYGHNMRNGSMFADLLKYQKEEFWREHLVIELDTPWAHREYEIFAVFYADEAEWIQESGRIYQVLHKKGVSKAKAVYALKEAGEYDTGITPGADCSMLFLVTCSYREAENRFVAAAALKDDNLDGYLLGNVQGVAAK